MKKFLFIFILISTALIAQNPNLGTSGAQFLQIPVGAKNVALGNAVVGSTNDATSLFWNPAGVAGINGTEATFSYMEWFKFFNVNAAGVTYNTGDFGVFGVSFIVMNMDKMEITTEQSPNGIGRFFDAQDVALGLTFARRFTDNFNFGITVKYVHQRIWNETADGMSFDVGTQYRIDFNNLTIAMSMSNFGPDLKYSGEDLNITYDKSSTLPLNRLTPGKLETDPYPLPMHFQVGIGIDLYSGEFVKIRSSLDASHPNDNEERVNFGTEFSFFDRLFVRGGYKYNYSDEKFTFGAGANLPVQATNIKFDYAYLVHDILPSVHVITVGIKF